MSYVSVPPGLSRSRVGKRIVYQSTLPGLKVKIWNKEAFDGFKQKGRFPNIDREMLDFSIKKLNEPEEMDVDETSLECMDVDTSSFEKLGPGTRSKVQVQRRSLGPKHFTKFGLPTTTHTPTHHHHKLLGHF